MESLLSWVAKIFPSIAGYQSFGSFKKRKKYVEFTVKDLCENTTCFPTIVIPLGKDKSVSHAICVIDDLIFDSTQPYALQLRKPSLDWVVQGPGIWMVYGAYRFHRRVDKNAPIVVREKKTNWSPVE
jgi:hypothetical protein